MRLVLATALLLAACSTGAGTPSPTPPQSGSPSPSGSPAPSASPAGLIGRSFVSTSVLRDGADFPLVPNTQLGLTFDPLGLHGSAGCNSIGGNYQIVDDVLLVDQLGTTDMACNPPALMAQETWYVTFLSSRPTLVLDGDTLTMTSDTTVVKMLDREVAEPDSALVGPIWTVDTIITGETGSSVPAGVVATLQFDATGRLTVNTGCNSGGGSYTADETTISVGAIALTKKACAVAAGQLEQAVMSVLNAGTVDYSIDAQRLMLSAGAAGLGLVADQ